MGSVPAAVFEKHAFLVKAAAGGFDEESEESSVLIVYRPSSMVREADRSKYATIPS
jgi:hypothetical protein